MTSYSRPNIYAGVKAKPVIQPERMKAAADDASELLKSLGNRHRLLILCLLAQGEHSVGQLAAFLDIRDSTVSQHLAILRRDQLIVARRDGQTIWYRIKSQAAQDVLGVLYQHFCATPGQQG